MNATASTLVYAVVLNETRQAVIKKSLCYWSKQFNHIFIVDHKDVFQCFKFFQNYEIEFYL
jgi:hypothetical protein